MLSKTIYHLPGQIPSALPIGDGPEAVPAPAGPERGVHGGHLLLLPDPHVHQLPAAPPAAGEAAAAPQPGGAAHRVLRAVWKEVQLCEDGNTRQERRMLRVQRRDAEGA